MFLFSLKLFSWKKFPPDIFLCTKISSGIMIIRCDRMSLSKARCRKEGSQAGAPFFYVIILKSSIKIFINLQYWPIKGTIFFVTSDLNTTVLAYSEDLKVFKKNPIRLYRGVFSDE